MEKRETTLAFSTGLQALAQQYPDLYLARVIAQYKDLYKVATEKVDLIAEISGKIRYTTSEQSDYPAVGDYVLIDRDDPLQGNAIIKNLIPRKSVFIRRAAGTSHDKQVVAANIDTVFICMSLNNDFNLRRLERYLAITWDSGASPVIVLTKSDLCSDLPGKLEEIYTVAGKADVIVTCGMTADGCEPIWNYLASDQTIAFLGSSGVGKSTLINGLLKKKVAETGSLRKDDKGRHITTRRELFLIPGGGAVIDTPGMREVGVENVDLATSFADIDELSYMCRFRDCGHENEPGCAVREAIKDGLINAERLVNYQKIKTEAKYDGLNSKQIEKEKMNHMFAEFGGIKNARNFVKSKHKNKP